MSKTREDLIVIASLLEFYTEVIDKHLHAWDGHTHEASPVQTKGS